MKMKKVFAALLSAMLVFAFAACSNGNSDSDSKTTSETEQSSQQQTTTEDAGNDSDSDSDSDNNNGNDIPYVEVTDEDPIDELLEITAIPVTEGIKVTILVPEGYNEVIFYRKKVSNSTDRKYHTISAFLSPDDWYTNTTTPDGEFSVIDYFVENDVTYSYWVECYSKEWKKKKSISVKATSFVTGMTPPSLANTPEGAYDSASHSVRFSSKLELLNYQSHVPGYDFTKIWIHFRGTDTWYHIAYPYRPGKTETESISMTSNCKDHVFRFDGIQIAYQNGDNGFYHFYVGLDAQIPDIYCTDADISTASSKVEPEMINLSDKDRNASINYINEDTYDSRVKLNFKTFSSPYCLDEIVHITNTINPLDTTLISNVKTNGVMAYLFNYKHSEDYKDSFSLAGVRYNQQTKKIEAFVETYKNISYSDIREGLLPPGTHATSDNKWTDNEFGFELEGITPMSDTFNVWIDVVANDGQTTGRTGTPGTYTVNFYSEDPGRQSSDLYAIEYSNSNVQPLATLVVGTEDVSNPYFTSLYNMISKSGCYASVQPGQTLTGTWEF